MCSVMADGLYLTAVFNCNSELMELAYDTNTICNPVFAGVQLMQQ